MANSSSNNNSNNLPVIIIIFSLFEIHIIIEIWRILHVSRRTIFLITSVCFLWKSLLEKCSQHLFFESFTSIPLLAPPPLPQFVLHVIQILLFAMLGEWYQTCFTTQRTRHIKLLAISCDQFMIKKKNKKKNRRIKFQEEIEYQKKLKKILGFRYFG